MLTPAAASLASIVAGGLHGSVLFLRPWGPGHCAEPAASWRLHLPGQHQRPAAGAHVCPLLGHANLSLAAGRAVRKEHWWL